MPDANAYTVGWISAIQTELVAAKVFLDEKHEKPNYQSHNDNNTYKFGSIQGHNVVIGVLPNGEYGIATATAVARDMMRSFPNIRIGLLVGIGGGAPTSTRDIRLGDVVVSSPENGHGGVIQYDYGKTIQGQGFQRTGFLNQAPALFRSAIATIQADYEIDGHQLNEAIDNILTQKPRLRKKYGRPDESSDFLFHSSFAHSNDNAGCAIDCAKSISKLIIRQSRTEVEDNPAIHYGTIASANQLMKDALKRDKIANDHGVICFEMEAAGLVNHFPCLIIRGICDYADSHKSNKWQGYAAMTAAAYAKDLLTRIPTTDTESEKKISEVCDLVEIIQDDLKSTEEKVQAIKISVERKSDDEILNWLTPLDYGPQHSDNLGRAEPGTGQWLLESDKYLEWCNNKGAVLFCPGIPGAGKTILTSIVIDDLDEDRIPDDNCNIGIAYIYCNAQSKGEQTAGHIVASLLKQLAGQHTTIPESVRNLHKHHERRRTRPTFDECTRVLHSVIQKFDKAFVLIDALDEFQDFDYGRGNFLSLILGLQTTSQANIFATSRPLQEITDIFQGTISLNIRANEDDMNRYLSKEMSKLKRFVNRNPALQEEIKDMVIKSANGMFLLATLHMKSLYSKTTVNGIRSALHQLKSTYDSVYRDIMKRIKMQPLGESDLAMKVLLWVTCAGSHLTVSELQEALAVEVGTDKIDENNMIDSGDILSGCAGLVIVDEKSNIVRLVHHTTREFLTRTRDEWFAEAESTISKVCLTYMSFRHFGDGRCFSDDQLDKRLQCNQLYNYVCTRWIHNLHPGGDIMTDLLHFFDKGAHIESLVQAVICLNDSSPHNGHGLYHPKMWQGLHLAAYFGWTDVMQQLIQNAQNLDVKDSLGMVPLMWAAENGHEAVVEQLLDTQRTSIDFPDDRDRTVFWFAAKSGHQNMVTLLLKRNKICAETSTDFEKASRMKNLALGYMASYQISGDAKVLQDSISYMQKALALIPKDHSSRPDWVMAHAISHQNMYWQEKALHHLESANGLFEEALELMAHDNPERSSLLNDLGTGYEEDYQKNKSLGYFNNFAGLDKAISYFQMAVNTVSKDDPKRADLVESLGSAHLRAYEEKWDFKHLDKAVSIFQTALSLTPDNGPERASKLHHLGMAFTKIYQVTRSSNYLQIAIEHHQQAFEQTLCPLTERLRFGASVIELHLKAQSWISSNEVANEVMALIPPFMRCNMKDKRKKIARFVAYDVSSVAVVASLAAGRPTSQAIQLFEIGRGCVLNSAYGIRPAISTLEIEHPSRASQLMKLKNKVDSYKSISKSCLRSAYQELDGILHEIRGLPRFDRFLLPPTEKELKAAAVNGPIVIINTSEYRCDALIIEQHGLWSLPLPDLQLSAIKVRIRESMEFETLHWLWDAMANPILDALGFKSTPVDGNWPRVCWIPTGPLCRFPIHAAGYYSPDSDNTVLDRVISSYSCSVTSLIRGLQTHSKKTNRLGDKALIYAPPRKSPKSLSSEASEHCDSSAPDFQKRDLEFASHEADHVERMCSAMQLQVVRPQLCEEVKGTLERCKVFHFAGHVKSFPGSPLFSYMSFPEPLRVLDFLELDFSHQMPHLAYLSGCRTGKVTSFIASNTIDESLHMTSAYQFSGFQNVIGTLSSIDDRSCMEVATRTYAWMEKHGVTDGSVSEALHHSIRSLRKEWMPTGAPRSGIKRVACPSVMVDDFDARLDWVPYVHYGI